MRCRDPASWATCFTPWTLWTLPHAAPGAFLGRRRPCQWSSGAPHHRGAPRSSPPRHADSPNDAFRLEIRWPFGPFGECVCFGRGPARWRPRGRKPRMGPHAAFLAVEERLVGHSWTSYEAQKETCKDKAILFHPLSLDGSCVNHHTGKLRTTRIPLHFCPPSVSLCSLVLALAGVRWYLPIVGRTHSPRSAVVGQVSNALVLSTSRID